MLGFGQSGFPLSYCQLPMLYGREGGDHAGTVREMARGLVDGVMDAAWAEEKPHWRKGDEIANEGSWINGWIHKQTMRQRTKIK
jgi:hypothetical protein